ncbi:LysR family transcriptional regulator [Chelativorans alearense]|uniref:LysR family transcriptional regulator n=1 Tax=Chelativorans alearense TaxID=2681495 RepID=UPI0013D71BD2|nr:LysR family transcriptional regulator [Chelativorans alearense]
MTHFDPVTARLVLALVRDGSIAKAAERENIAPSAISRRIADLELRSGIVLFDRSAQGVALTAAGAVYAEGCRRIFREIADLETAMAGFASGEGGQLRIASTSSALSGRLPELLAEYAKSHPAVQLDIREMAARAALTALEDAQVDLAIIADYYDFADFDVMPFEDDHVWVIASPGHPLAGRIAARERLTFEDVAHFEVVGVHHGGALDRLLSDAVRKSGRALGERVNVESFPSLVRMVEAGFGIGFLRNSSIHLLAGTDLVYTPLSEEWARRKLVVARRRKVRAAASVEAFVALCRESYTVPDG